MLHNHGRIPETVAYMKIVLTGGGTGGHFYPLIAVAAEIRKLVTERKLIDPEIYYIGPTPFDRPALAELGIEYKRSPAGKIRRYTSILNVFDIFKTAWGVVQATLQLFSIYPDVVFSKGGYASFPTVFAARILRIPVIIHESDAVPGRANMWAATFARHIGIAHPDAIDAFPEDLREKMALVGHPIRAQIEAPAPEGGYEFLKLDPNVPTLFFMGGSLGSQTINEVVLDTLPLLIEKYNIVHQTGREHLEGTQAIAETILRNSRYENRYRSFGLLNALAIRMITGITSIVVSRAGSGTIFEIASWGIPSILIPIPTDVSHDQTRNAFSYARSGAAVVLQQKNLTPHVLLAEIERIMGDEQARSDMSEAAKQFARPDAAEKIAKIILDTALEHTHE